MRITIKDLENRVAIINTLTNSPQKPYTQIDGKLIANIGCYYIDQAYSGNQLVRISTEGGGVTDVSHTGYVSNKDLFNWINAFIQGLKIQSN